ncbi:MAG: glycosyl transferase family 1 [Phycisphaeraceae bacterium]|nr:glycosyl transferase family 1 [Phycisphaeraceae bacterium]
MKILHVITRLILGGAQQNTVVSCAAQVAAGHQVWLAFGPIYGPEGTLLPDAERSGATIEQVASLRRSVSPIHDLRAYDALRRLIRRVQPDIVHTHSSKAGILGRAAAWREGVGGVVHTVHGLPFHDRQSQIVHRLYVHAERWAARRCHRLIGITQAMADAFEQAGVSAVDQFEIVPSGVDAALFHPGDDRSSTRAAYGIDADCPVVGIVARLDALKGHDDLLDVLADLVRDHPGLRVVFVGDGYHRAVLEQRVADERFDAHVIFAGLVPATQVPSLYRALDLMVLPSYQEGQGRTLVEAQMCGCAVVGYNVGGIGEVCDDGRAGRLVPLGDRRALRAAVHELLADAVERRALADRGREHACRNFSQETMIERLERIYRSLGPAEEP